MTTVEKQAELRDKIIFGLDTVYERLIEFKKHKKSELIIIKEDKIVRIKIE